MTPVSRYIRDKSGGVTVETGLGYYVETIGSDVEVSSRYVIPEFE